MAARNKRPPDIREIFSLHLQASQRREELLQEIRELRGQGKLREAKRLLKTAEEIQRRLEALEEGCRAPPRLPGPRSTGDGDR